MESVPVVTWALFSLSWFSLCECQCEGVQQPDCVIDRLCVTLQVTLNSTRLTGTTSATRPRISSASSCASMSRRDTPANKLLPIHGKEMLHSLNPSHSITPKTYQHLSRKAFREGLQNDSCATRLALISTQKYMMRSKMANASLTFDPRCTKFALFFSAASLKSIFVLQ